MSNSKKGKKNLVKLTRKPTLGQQQRQARLKEIYVYFRQELNKENRKTSPYFTPHLDLEPTLAKELARKQKQTPEYDFYAEFRKNKKNLTYKLNKRGQTHLLRQTSQAYQEEVADHRSQIKYWQAKAGLTKVQANTLVKKTQQIKLFFPEKGEHKAFWAKNKEFKKLWAEISQSKGSIKERSEIERLSRELYQKSPWRIRDRFLQAPKEVGGYLAFEGKDGQTVIHTEKPKRSDWNMGEVWDKYYKQNPFEPTKKHYRQAVLEVLRTGRPKELVPEQELDLDKYGNPRLKEGQMISFSSNKPGKRWTVYKKTTDWQEVEKKQIHEVAHQGYIEEYGSELEVRTWKMKKDKALCWVEAMGLGDCSSNVGTSNWWCLECIYYGPYHPPVLPQHCPWEYTYRRDVCAGSKKHADANKQWHFSSEGEKKRDWIKGGDWGSCHIGTFGKTRGQKSFGKRFEKKR